MFTCRMPTVGKNGGFEVLVVGWMTHSLVDDNPPNDPQYSRGACLAEGLVGTGPVTTGVMAWCSRPRWPVRYIEHIFMANVFLLFSIYVPNFHVCMMICSLFV